MYKQATRESVLIVCAAVVLGFSYTLFAGKGFFGSSKTTGIAPSHGAGPAPTPISLTEARTLFETGGAIFVDSRHHFDFRRGHIRSAVNIPLANFESAQKTVAALPRDKVIIVYCDGSECNSSIELAAKLYEQGFGGVRFFWGGWQDWVSNKLPTESSQ